MNDCDPCDTCNGSGICQSCFDEEDDCEQCDVSGECPDCQGEGIINGDD